MASVAAEERVHGFRFHALGGHGRLRLAGVTAQAARDATAAAVSWLREAEAKYSRFQVGSLVSRLNAGETVEADDGLLHLLAAAERALRRTSGRLDVTALPLWRLWHERETEPADAELRAALELRGFCDVIIDAGGVRLARAGMAVDFGGIGKEWCVDAIATLLQGRGVRDFLVELAGDVAARGRQSGRHDGWWVLLPGCARACLLRDAALATSGHGARARQLGGRRISHLIDARTGRPASGRIRSATVLAPRCVDAGIAASDAALVDDADDAFARLAGLPGFVRTAEGALFTDPALAGLCADVSP